MICSAVLRGAVALPKDVDDAKSLIDSFVEIMKNGNALYEIVSASAINIDLTVEEVIEHSELQLIMPHGITAIHEAQNLGTHLYQLSETQKSFACILIIYPNLSVAITARNGIVSVFDSHCHFMKGATIAICEDTMLPELCIYLEKFCNKYYNSTLCASNLIPVSLFI